MCCVCITWANLNLCLIINLSVSKLEFQSWTAINAIDLQTQVRSNHNGSGMSYHQSQSMNIPKPASLSTQLDSQVGKVNSRVYISWWCLLIIIKSLSLACPYLEVIFFSTLLPFMFTEQYRCYQSRCVRKFSSRSSVCIQIVDDAIAQLSASLSQQCRRMKGEW